MSLLIRLFDFGLTSKRSTTLKLNFSIFSKSQTKKFNQRGGKNRITFCLGGIVLEITGRDMRKAPSSTGTRFTYFHKTGYECGKIDGRGKKVKGIQRIWKLND